jgi:ribosomal silencing factor RsfS
MTQEEIYRLIEELRYQRAEHIPLIDLAAAQKVTANEVTHVSRKTDEIHASLKSYVDQMEKRVRDLENWRNEQKGIWRAVVLVATVIGAAMGALTEYIIASLGFKSTP